MATDTATTITEPGNRIWRFLAFNAIATTIGAIVFALTFENPTVAVPLTLAALVTGFAVILHEMLQLLGSDEERLSHAEPAHAPAEPSAQPAAVSAAKTPIGQPIAH